MSDAPRVLVADAQPAARLGTRAAIERAGMVVVAEASDADGAVRAARRERADVCLVDAGLPGGGVAAAGTIATSLPGSVVIVLAAVSSEDELLAALRAGAVGYLLKDIGPAQLARAVRGALHGEAPLPRALAACVVEELRTRSGTRRVQASDGALVTLSPRETTVLALLRRGLTTRQVAQRLGVSPVTVRRHASDAAHRLGVHGRDAALALTRRPGAP
jgi:DNA-binding NarL/FixJ family response regulator